MKNFIIFFKNFFSFTILFVALSIVTPTNMGYALGNMQVSEEDKAQLRAMGFSDKDIEEAAEMLNNITPEEQTRLEAALKAVEAELESYGIDPTNPDPELLEQFTKDMLTPPTTQPKESNKPIAQEPEIKEEPEIEQVHSIEEAPYLLNAILKHINVLRQKISLNEAFSKSFSKYQQPLNEFIFYLNILNKKELLRHLTSAPFQDLYDSLQFIYHILATQEPRIKLEAINTLNDYDDPYQQLGVSYNASQEEIQEAFKKLKNIYDPEKIEKNLKAKHVSAKKIVEESENARLTMASIVDAYQRICTPQERAITDRELKEMVHTTGPAYKNSQKAFNTILDAFNTIFCTHEVLAKISNLLKVYEPEALALRKAQEKWEQEALSKAQEEQKRKAPTAKIPSSSNKGAAPDYSRYYAHSGFAGQYGGYNYPSLPNAYNPYDSGRDFNSSPSQESSKGGPSAQPKDNKTDKKDNKEAAKDLFNKDGLKDSQSSETPKNTKTDTTSPASLEKVAPESYALSVAENALNALEAQFRNPSNLTSFFKKFEQSLTRPISRTASNEELASQTAFLREALRHLNFLNKINTQKFEQSSLLKDRFKVISTNYQNLINNITSEVLRVFNPQLPNINQDRYNKHHAPFINNTIESPDNYYELYKLMESITNKLNSLQDSYSRASTQVADAPKSSLLTDEQARAIKEASGVMSFVEVNSKLLYDEQQERLPEKVFKEVENYLKDPITSDNPQALNTSETTRSSLSENPTINKLKELMNAVPTGLAQGLNILEQQENALKDVPLLTNRWNLIQDNYGNTIRSFYQDAQKALDKDYAIQIAAQEKYNKHYRAFSEDQPETVRSRLNQTDNLQQYYKIAEKIKSTFDNITKKLIPSKEEPASNALLNNTEAEHNNSAEEDINTELDIQQAQG